MVREGIWSVMERISLTDGHLIPSWCLPHHFGYSGMHSKNQDMDLDILTLLKISCLVEVEPSKLDNFDFFTAGFSKPFWVVLPN